MIWPFPGNTKITHGFHEQRPVLNPVHDHGAVDVRTSNGSMIIAPEKGILFNFFSIRPHDSMYWNAGEMKDNPYKNYFYDMYGGLIILKGESGFTHIFTHIYMNQMFNKDLDEDKKDWSFKEEKMKARFPIFCFTSDSVEVFRGSEIGKTGNSGYSTGPHCHYEIHDGFRLQKHEDRPNPQQIIWKNFQ